jgi:hypothetical protein
MKNLTSSMATAVIAGVTFISPLALAAPEISGTTASVHEIKHAAPKTAEPKNKETQQVSPQVQAQVEKSEADKRAQLLKDAQAAVDQTHKALDALDQGKKDEALAALEQVTGKLDLILARDPKLALAPVGVSTVIMDLYASPETVKKAVAQARVFLDNGNVQQARSLLDSLASESDLEVTNIPLATYPDAIKAIAPLIDAGKIDEAKTRLTAALNTLVIETYATPLPAVRAKAILNDAEKLAEKSGRSQEDNKKLHDQIEAARQQLKLGQVLGYGSREAYKPLYDQLDSIEKKTEGGKSGKGFFDQIQELLKSFKDRIS